MQNLSPLKAAEGADFPKLVPDSVGVAGSVVKQLSSPDDDSNGVHDLCLPCPLLLFLPKAFV